MRLHERTTKVTAAEARIRRAVQNILDEADLTDWETIRAVTGALTAVLQAEARMGIRMERFGNPEALGDVEGG